jgi:DNA ligase-1
MAAAVEELKAVYSELPSYDAIVPHLLRTNVVGARAACHLVPGVPVTPMLAKPSKGIGEVLTRFEGQTFTCEWKYDGERAQVVSSRWLARHISRECARGAARLR